MITIIILSVVLYFSVGLNVCLACDVFDNTEPPYRNFLVLLIWWVLVLIALFVWIFGIEIHRG